MGQQTTTIATVRFFRQDDPPPSAPDGATWVTPSDGAGNDTSSRYVYDAAADRWELESAVGPSEPTLGTPVAGATWRDTANATAKQYDGTAFVNLGVTDHANLSNVSADQHHRAVEGRLIPSYTGTFTGSVGNGTAFYEIAVPEYFIIDGVDIQVTATTSSNLDVYKIEYFDIRGRSNILESGATVPYDKTLDITPSPLDSIQIRVSGLGDGTDYTIDYQLRGL